MITCVIGIRKSWLVWVSYLDFQKRISLTDKSIAISLMVKFHKASKGTAESKLVFEELTSSLSPELTEKWGQSEAKAMREHGDKLRIYDEQEENSEIYYSWFLCPKSQITLSSSNSK